MKLRNKKTGEIREGYISVVLQNNDKFPNPLVHNIVASIFKLNEEWEDYKEPLIKDEKIRKAVRAWAEAENIPNNETVYYNDCDYSFGWYNSEIAFSKGFVLENKEYSIIELCGEDDA